MLFRQFVDGDLGCASYLIGDESERVAVVVDPAFAIELYREEARRCDVRLTACFETHTHADHLSGHGRLALEEGLPVHVHRAGAPDFPFVALEDGGELEAGAVSIRVVHTPGHRPEHCSFVVSDRSRADEPWFVLTGDSLFVGDAARPDLAVEPREGAADLFHSLRRLLELPDGVEVYPGHVAGSLCGAGMSSKASTTIGFERRCNRALLFSDKADFVNASASVSTPRPPNVERIVALNRGPLVAAPPPLRRLDGASGAVVLDVRPAEDFAAGYVPGAISVPVAGSSFGTRVGFLLAPSEPIVIHASSTKEAETAAARLHAVGFLELQGFVLGVDTPEHLNPVDLDELSELLETGAVQLVDVREKSERDGGYIPGSRHVPYRLVRECAGTLRGDRPVVTICESGPRAAIAASVLAAEGIDVRPVLHGGISDWEAQGRQTVEFRRCGSS